MVEGNRYTMGARSRAVVSLLVALHLLAITTPALRNATDYGEPSYAVARLDDCFRRYTQAFHLHHAYFFFAPDPGPSYLLHYDVYSPDGGQVASGVIPDRQRHFPRLLYHRHFMLSEQWASSFDDPEPPPETAAQDVRRRWQARRRIFQGRGESFRAHLQYVYGQDDVRLTLIEHRQPTLAEFFAGVRIDAPEMYQRIPVLGNTAPEALESPPATPPNEKQNGTGPALIPPETNAAPARAAPEALPRSPL